MSLFWFSLLSICYDFSPLKLGELALVVGLVHVFLVLVRLRGSGRVLAAFVLVVFAVLVASCFESALIPVFFRTSFSFSRRCGQLNASRWETLGSRS